MTKTIKTRLDALEQSMGEVMPPDQLPETCLIACFDPAKDDQGRELPIIEIGGIFRLAGESEDDFKDRVLRAVCKGQPIGFKPVLFAHRQAPGERIKP